MNRSPQVQSAHEYPGLYKIEIFVPSYFDTYSFFEKFLNKSTSNLEDLKTMVGGGDPQERD